MSTFRYNQRGRTRQPKNLALHHHKGTVGQPITFAHFKSSGSATIVANAAHLDNNLTSSVSGRNGYNTENQMYLHLCLSQSTAASRNVTLYGYNRQFGTWGKLKFRSSSVSGSANSFMESYVDLTVSSESEAVIYLTVPVEGVDRVGFVSGTTTGLTLYVAGSTL